ncbi:VOC family protein, partial [Escherichia coli]|nr:VOC family protein [Escherichia coli]
MFSHIMIGSNDLEASRKFYDATLGALGARAGSDNHGRIFYMHNGGILL